MSRNHRIETVQLELVRPGPTHGQLLSPLTPYLALCSDESPVTVYIGLEHWRLLNRLERLRYERKDFDQQIVRTPQAARESELKELGHDIGQIFASIPTLGRELGRALGSMANNNAEPGLVHLRLVISGSELSLLPYELLVSPAGYPGAGSPLLLQPQVRVVMTREARKGRGHPPLRWDRPPKILFVSAAPEGLTIPAKPHLEALRKALEPWIRWDDDPEKRLVHVAEHITHLEHASIETIRDACEAESYTHVHILAHGGEYQEAGERRFGLVLCDRKDSQRKRIVDGQTVAEALHTMRATGERSSPWVVSLATCDSGNVGSVVAPGGSIAYDLHAHGVPWVFASQFPLTKGGSKRMTKLLYERLLLGEDPRVLLDQVRRALYVGKERDHDWASLVAYATLPPNLFDEVEQFRSDQIQRAVTNTLQLAKYHQQRADEHEEAATQASEPEAVSRRSEAAARETKAKAALESARGRVKRWIDSLPEGSEPVIRKVHEECYGVAGSTEKQLAEVYFKRGEREKEREALRQSADFYDKALTARPDSHWTATQWLALVAVLNHGPNLERWAHAYGLAKTELALARDDKLGWAHGTMLELEMLRLYHAREVIDARTIEPVKQKVAEQCKHLLEHAKKNKALLGSTRRQLARYGTWWTGEHLTQIIAVAELALEHLDK